MISTQMRSHQTKKEGYKEMTGVVCALELIHKLFGWWGGFPCRGRSIFTGLYWDNLRLWVNKVRFWATTFHLTAYLRVLTGRHYSCTAELQPSQQYKSS